MNEPVVHTAETVEAVARLEQELAVARQKAADAIRDQRTRLGLSLREAGKKVKLTAPALRLLERGETWKTSTARRVVRGYGRTAAQSEAA